MDPATRIASIRAQLLHRTRLNDDGVHDKLISASVRSGTWTVIARGLYVDSAAYARWTSDELHVARAIATAIRAASVRPVFSHVTAAVLLGLPSYGMRHERVHVTLPSLTNVGSSTAIVRHQAKVSATEIVEVGGLRCTSLSRTMSDVARFATTEQAAVVLDEGLRRLGASPRPARGELRDATEAWLADRYEALAEMTGQRGVALARRRLAFADARAESVAESLSRVQLRRLGYSFKLQVEVAAPSGSMYRVDFELVGKRTLGEVDGNVKYTDQRLRGARSAEDVVLAEKRREDWIRGTTGFGLVRWGFRESRSAELLGARLRAFHVPPP